MEYYNSFHSISEFIKQGQANRGASRLLLDSQRLGKAQKADREGGAPSPKSRLLQLMRLAEQQGVRVEERPTQELQNLLEQRHYRGYILALDRLSQMRDYADENSDRAAVRLNGLPKAGNIADILARMPRLVLLLDGVLDVGNLGAILRSGDLFGIGAVLVSHRSAGRSDRDAANQLGRASVGASAWVPLIEGNLAQMARQLQSGGYWLYGADMDGQVAACTEFSEPCALVLGSEERGLSPRLKQLCDALVCIPVEGHLDSLNVSAAGAVLMYEIRRQWQSE